MHRQRRACETSGEQLSINGVDGVNVPLSDSASTTTSFEFHPSLGSNVVNAYRVDSNGNASAGTAISFGFGKWADSKFESYPADGASMHHDQVQLAVIPDATGYLPEHALATYAVSTTPDMANIVWTSDATDGSAEVPAESLPQQQDYFWRASITGADGTQPASRSPRTSSAFTGRLCRE